MTENYSVLQKIKEGVIVVKSGVNPNPDKYHVLAYGEDAFDTADENDSLYISYQWDGISNGLPIGGKIGVLKTDVSQSELESLTQLMDDNPKDIGTLEDGTLTQEQLISVQDALDVLAEQTY